MRVLDLFSGIGGFSLAAHSVGFTTVAFCEIEPYPTRVLHRHFPGVPVFPDVKELTADALADALGYEPERERAGGAMAGESGSAQSDGGTVVRHTARSCGENGARTGDDLLAESGQGSRIERPMADPASVRPSGVREEQGEEGGDERRLLESERGGTRRGIDIICGGFPCQDLSYAGAGAGLEGGTRSGLFREVIRLAGELRPRYILLENVAALLSRGLGTVLGELAEIGYDAEWACVKASDVGAPHRRDRIWILAYPQGAFDAPVHTEYVLSHLTPFGSETWSTATDSNAWANDLDRTGMSGKHNLGLGTAARTNSAWPTPTARDWKDGRPCDVPVNALLGRAVWPTPRAREGNAGGAGSAGSIHNSERGYLDGVVQEYSILPESVASDAPQGSLNPSWVETLMGYPIGYTLPEGEPLTTLPGSWPATSPDERGWMTPKAGDAIFASGSTSGRNREMSTHLPTQVKLTQGWPAGLGAPQHEWEPPRLTTVKEHRSARLKALGNSIVPQVAALWMQAIREYDGVIA